MLLPAFWAIAGGLNQEAVGGFYAGYNVSSSKHKTFESFRTSYNLANKGSMSKELQPWGLGIGGKTLGGFIRIKYFGGEINYTTVRNNNVAEFINGEKRHFDMKQSWVCSGIWLGPDFGKFYLMADIGFGGGKALINCYYEYNDGTKSYGQETLLSGQYTSISLAGYYGVRAGFTLGHPRLMLTMQAIRFGSGFDNNRTSLGDIADAGSLSPTEYPSGLPLDYVAYLNRTSNYDYGSDNYVKADIKTWKFMVGLEFNLNKPSSN